MSRKVALITGITGQDGAYLADFLLSRGLYRARHQAPFLARSTPSASTISTATATTPACGLFLHYGDMTDSTNLLRLLGEIKPTEVYNLAAQSHVQVSFETPEYTANTDALGTLRLLEAIRILRMQDDVRFYQASTSELFGKVQETPQRETTPFYPRSPYAVAKLYAYWITVNYREAYGMHASNGILFNHELPIRGETFVTRKITRAVAAIERGYQDRLYLGNLDAKRDWGHARDYVEGMWRILQQDAARRLRAGDRRDAHRARVRRARLPPDRPPHRMARRAATTSRAAAGAPAGCWSRSTAPTAGRPRSTCCSAIPPRRSAKLGWRHRTSFQELVAEMVEADRLVMKSNGSQAMPMNPSYTLRNKRVWVAGHRGLVGSALVRRLQREGCEILTAPRELGRPAPARPGRALDGRGAGRRRCSSPRRGSAASTPTTRGRPNSSTTT